MLHKSAKSTTKSGNIARALRCIAKRYEFDSTTIQLTKSKQNTQQITRRHKQRGGNTTSSLIRRQILPEFIPVGARIVVRTYKIAQLGGGERLQTAADRLQTAAGSAQTTNGSAQKIEYHDAIGHVISWDGETLHLMRDAAANGSRPEQEMFIDARTIVRLKPIPERKRTT